MFVSLSLDFELSYPISQEARYGHLCVWSWNSDENQVRGWGDSSIKLCLVSMRPQNSCLEPMRKGRCGSTGCDFTKWRWWTEKAEIPEAHWLLTAYLVKLQANEKAPNKKFGGFLEHDNWSCPLAPIFMGTHLFSTHNKHIPTPPHTHKQSSLEKCWLIEGMKLFPHPSVWLPEWAKWVDFVCQVIVTNLAHSNIKVWIKRKQFLWYFWSFNLAWTIDKSQHYTIILNHLKCVWELEH